MMFGERSLRKVLISLPELLPEFGANTLRSTNNITANIYLILPADRLLIEARNAKRSLFVYTVDIEAQCDRFSAISVV